MGLAFRRLTMASLLALLAAAPEAAAWDWKQVDSKEGRMSLSSGRVMPEGVERGVDRDAGSLFMAEFAWWGFENQGWHQIEAGLYWTEDRGGWDTMHVVRDSFFDEFSALDEEWIETGATEGPTISTVIGESETFAFDIDSDIDTFGDDARQCLGFTHGWDRRLALGWKHYPKWLNFYACGKGKPVISETGFLHILSGFGIEGEFEALVEGE